MWWMNTPFCAEEDPNKVTRVVQAIMIINCSICGKDYSIVSLYYQCEYGGLFNLNESPRSKLRGI